MLRPTIRIHFPFFLINIFILGPVCVLAATSCSSVNTGASFDGVFSQYQSAGACQGTCSGYAFAILQDNTCWCSNYSPPSTLSDDLCNENCPGFPSDKCGNVTAGYFSYIQIGQSSGTYTLSTSTATARTSAKLTTQTVTVNQGSTVIVTSLLATDPSYTSPTTTETTSQATASSVTKGGVPQSEGSPQITTSSSSSSFWSSTGKVIAVFVVVGAVIIATIVASLLFWMRRRSRRGAGLSHEPSHFPNGNGNGIGGGSMMASSDQKFGRSPSVLGLLGRKQPPPSSSNYSPYDSQAASKPSVFAVPMVDQRLDPHSMMARFEDNMSHASFRDEEDYSRRVWRVTNASDSDSLHSMDHATRI